jgi:hypothetical protein
LTRLYRGCDHLLHLTRADRARIAGGLDRTRLYWIDDEFTTITAHASTDLPTLVIDRDLVSADDGLLVWSRPLFADQIAAASWTRDGDTFHLATYRSIGTGLNLVPVQRLREEVGWLIPMNISQLHHGQRLHHGASHPAAAAITTWQLIAQRAASTEPADLEKSTRARYARAGKPRPEVTILRVRAPRASDTRPSRSGAGTPSRKPLTERIWITGYWRQQPYGPGRSQRRPRYIFAFLRGPADAPIRLSTTVRVLAAPTSQPQEPTD